jgi:hypothetical protein
MAAVYAARIGHAQSKAVLLAMADHAADDGSSIHPSVETLAEKTELSRRTVQRALADLKTLGLIHEVSRRADAACHYRIDLWAVEARRRPERHEQRKRRSASVTPLSRRRSASVTPLSETDQSIRGVSVTPPGRKGRQRDAGRSVRGVTVTPEPVVEATTNVKDEPEARSLSASATLRRTEAALVPVNEQNGTHGLAEAETGPIHVKATVVGETTATWNAYAAAYAERYGAPPIRNAKNSGMLAQFLKRVPRAEAPAIAEHYVRSSFALYVKALHPVDLLLRDAEKLRTEWATGRRVTEHRAREADKMQGKGDFVRELIEEAKREEVEAAAAPQPQPEPPQPEPKRPAPPSQYQDFTGQPEAAWDRFLRGGR